MPNNDVIAALSLQIGASTIKLRTEMDAAAAATRQASRQMRADLMETRAGIKQVGEEIGINLNRHLVSFLAKIPGAGIFAQAFPIAAVVGIGAAFVEAGKKVAEFYEKNREVAGAIGEGMDKIRGRISMTNNEIALSNARLEAQIAKLEHKPTNNVAIALAEARVEADKLSSALNRDMEDINKLLKDHHIDIFGQLLTGQTRTGPMSDEVKKRAQELEDIDREKTRALASLRDATPARIAEVTRQYDEEWMKKAQETRDWAAGKWNAMSGRDAEGNAAPGTMPLGAWFLNDANKTIVGSFGNTIESAMAQRNLSLAQSADQSKSAGLQDQKTAADERLQALQKELEVRKILHQDSAGEEVLYWQKYVNAFAVGSQQWIEVNRKYEEAQVKFAQNFMERGKLADPLRKWKEEQAAPAPADATRDVGMEMMADAGRWGEAWKGYNTALGENAQIHAKLNAAMQTVQIRIQEETGAITRQQAALSEAQIKLNAFREESEAVQKQMRGLSSDSTLTEAQRATSLQQLQNKLDEITGQQLIAQAETDAMAKSMELRNEMGVMFNEWIQRADDVKTQMRSLWDQFSGSLNSEMSKAITGQKTNFSGAFRGTATSAANFGLQHVEAGIMQHIPGLAGLLGSTGKLGTQGNPMYVRMADSPGGIGGPTSQAMQQWKGAGGTSNFGSFLRTIGGLAGLGAGVAGGGAGMPSLSTDFSLDNFQLPFQGLEGINIPAMAFGGPVLAGMPYDIGEMGRERFVPESNGHIIPNHALGNGGAYYEIHAEGADAAAIQQRMARALEQVHGSAVQNATAVAAERRRRTPSAYRG